MSQQGQNREHEQHEQHEQQFLDAQSGQLSQQIPSPQHQPNPATPSNTSWLGQYYPYDGIPPVPGIPQAVPPQFFGSTLLSTATPPPGPNTASPARQASLHHRMLHSVPFLKLACDEACWRCRNSHTKCEPKTPTICRRCAENKGNVKIDCRRGDVSNLRVEVPFLCLLQAGPDRLHVSQLPQYLRPGAIHLSETRHRRHLDQSRYKGGGIPYPNRRLFWSVVNTTVPNINSYIFLKDLEVSSTKVPYSDLLITIVWELEDNPTAARLMGIGSLAHIVAFLEAACLYESQFGDFERANRLVYSAMHLLIYCLEALRLLDKGLLAANPHLYCSEAAGCVCPVFRGLTEYSQRYTKALTQALFSKKKGSDKHKMWPIIFYSLCLQAHVRRALMVIEASLHGRHLTCINSSAGGIVDLGCSTPTYLVAAITLFEQISLQKDGKLALKVSNALAQVQPSIYLKEAGIDASNIHWGNWHNEQENIPRYLRSIFAVPDHPLQQIHQLASGPPTDLDYNLEVPVAPRPPTPNMETTSNIFATHYNHNSDVNMMLNGAAVPMVKATDITTLPGSQSHSFRLIPDPVPHCDDEIASEFSRTSHAAGSDSLASDAMSFVGSVASCSTVRPGPTYVAPPSMGSSTLQLPMDANSAHDYGTFNQGALAQSWELYYQLNRGNFPPSS